MKECLPLEQGGGLQAFAVLTSRTPLGDFEAWRRQGVSWQRTPGEAFVGGFSPEDDGYWGGSRGQPVTRELRAPTALQRLCDALGSCDLDAFEVLAFPVEAGQ
jgi:hypothetical protein